MRAASGRRPRENAPHLSSLGFDRLDTAATLNPMPPPNLAELPLKVVQRILAEALAADPLLADRKSVV